MIDEIREAYKNLFNSTYNFMKQGIKENNFEKIYFLAKPIVEAGIKNQFGDIDKRILESLALEMFDQYVGGISYSKPSVIREGDSEDWYNINTPKYSYFWLRYSRYLSEYKKWENSVIESIDISTNEIIKSLGNPNGIKDFDKRGLVLGYVQSGKTANFTGLINKAFDIGYKLVIVLAGMHNDLRSQTQIRLEEEIVGAIDEETGKPIGVAQIRNDEHPITTWTTKEKDISRQDSGKSQNYSVPNLLVVKKNKDVLEALKDLLSQSIRLSSSNAEVPVLIIDDEADQASVDTSNANKNEDPKTINLLIREILELFKKKAYVGYTATPFANLLINSNREHSSAGQDLYPKDFVVALPKPEGYCGPEEYFNVTGYEENNRPLFIRHLSNEDLEMFDSMKKVVDADKFTNVPQSMQEAILAFLIAIAVRNLRGQTGKHNSMLIHTSRFTETQGVMQEVVNSYFEALKEDILYNKKSPVFEKLESLYVNDFVAVQKEYDDQLKVHSWENVKSTIRVYINDIRVMEINGRSGEALNYHKFKKEGLNVIAIGGDKLSRGLTLEGLSISYYYRSTNMYDTLMQMGRWFGYRTGYMDLCRIYTSETIAENFEHMARVMVELRKEFDKVAKDPNMTPERYAIKMLDHDKMNVTSLAKMKAADYLYDHGGTTRQTRVLRVEQEILENNMKATENLINNITKFNITNPADDTTYHIAKDVDSKLIIEYLKAYETATSANKVHSKELADYIQRLNDNEKLLKFNVVVVDVTKSTLAKKDIKERGISHYPVKLGHLQLKSAVVRAVKRIGKKVVSTVDMGSIVASKQEYIDLPSKSQEERNEQNPALIIYPLHPEVDIFKKLDVNFNETFVPIGWALSFPDVVETYVDENGNTVGKTGNYIINKSVK